MRTERLLIGGLGHALVGRAGALIEVISLPLLTWAYGLDAFGLYAALWALVRIATAVCEAGMTPALQRFAAGPAATESRGAVEIALAISLGLAVIGAAVALGFAPVLARALGLPDAAPAIRLFAVALPLWTLVEVATAAVRARGAFGPEIRIRIFYEQSVRLVLGLAFAAAGIGGLGLIAAHLLSVALAAGLAVRLLVRHYPRRTGHLDRSRRRALLHFAALMAPVVLIRRLSSDLPVLMLAPLSGEAAAGLYAIARKIASLVHGLRQATDYVLAPLSAGHRDDLETVRRLAGLARRLMLAVAPPLTGALLLAQRDILLLFDPAIALASMALVILLIGRLAEALAMPAPTLVEMLGPRHFPLLNGLAGVIVMTLGTWWLAPGMGAAGAALATAAGLAVVSLLAMAQSARMLSAGALLGFDRRTGLVAAGGFAAPGALAMVPLAWPTGLATVVATAMLAATLVVQRYWGLPPVDRIALARSGGLASARRSG